MATNVFNGINGVWPNVANWSLGIIPIDTHDVIIPGTTQTSLTTGLDRTGDTAGAGLHLNSLFVHEGYGGNIGALGNPLKCTVANAILDEPSITHRGSGEFWYNAETGTGLNVTGAVVVNSRNQTRAFTLGGDRNVSYLSCVQGETEVTASRTGIINTAFLTVGPGGAVSLVDRSVTSISTMIQTAGTFAYHGFIDAIHVSGGVCTALLNSDATVVHVSGGLFIFNSGNALTAAHLTGGTFDTTRTAIAKAITILFTSRSATLLRTNLIVTNEYNIFDIDTD